MTTRISSLIRQQTDGAREAYARVDANIARECILSARYARHVVTRDSAPRRVAGVARCYDYAIITNLFYSAYVILRLPPLLCHFRCFIFRCLRFSAMMPPRLRCLRFTPPPITLCRRLFIAYMFSFTADAFQMPAAILRLPCWLPLLRHCLRAFSLTAPCWRQDAAYAIAASVV